MIATAARWRACIAAKEIDGSASVPPQISPVSCVGRNPFGVMV